MVTATQITMRARTPAEKNSIGSDFDQLGRIWCDGRDRGLILFTCADPDDLLHRKYEDLPVAHLPGPSTANDGVDGGFDKMIGHTDLDPDFFLQLHLHGGAAIGFDALHLPTVALDPMNRQAVDLSAEKSLQNIIQLLGTDDGHHQLHVRLLHSRRLRRLLLP